MTVWALQGNEAQQALVRDALAACDFPFDRLAPSLAREGKQSIRVDWADLSRHTATSEAAAAEHQHVHDGDATAHPVERVVDGRRRVLGLFYLPPHTRVVLDVALQGRPPLAVEVFLAEAAHAVDYHYMTPEMRRAFVNSVHTDQIAPDADVSDGAAFQLDGHTCAWFDVGAYADWVGEAFMEGFIEAYAPTVPVTINLNHPVGPEDRQVIRDALTPTEAPVFATTRSPVYHDSHAGVTAARSWPSAGAARAAGLRPCRVCKPGVPRG